jgi:DNA-binding transcriptional LysR family regulator
MAAAALGRSASSEAALDRGVVRVTASEIVGCEVLPPNFADFHARHPGVAVELAVTNRNEDLARGDADIAVRMVRRRRAGSSPGASARRASASTPTATIAPASARRAPSQTCRITT